MPLLNIVTDEQLLTSQIVKTILLCIIGGGIIYNLIRIFRTKDNARRIINSLILVLLVVVAFIAAKQYRLESSLMNDPHYVQGTTVGNCSVFGLGSGIEFEYEVNGQTYHECNTYYPVSRDSILVPGGKYMVRYSEKFPDKGRMNFNKPVK